jgi:hypothetical protein
MFTRYYSRKKVIRNKMKRTIRKTHAGGKALLLGAFIVVAAVLGTLMLLKYQARHQTTPLPAITAPTGSVSISLFFSSAQSDGFVRESREIDACGTDTTECILSALEELANGPLGDLEPTIPEKSTFRSVRIEGDTAIVDLGKELVADLPKGSSAEMTAVYSIVNTISYNYSSIKKVTFLVEGKTINTLGGHLDLRKPIEPDFRLEKKQ